MTTTHAGKKPRRNAGEGGISEYATKAGPRYAIVYWAFDPKRQAKRQYKVRGFTSRTLAAKTLREKLGSVEQKRHVGFSRLTLGDYLRDEWLPALRTTVRPGTYSSYESLLRVHVLSHAISGVKLQDVDGRALTALYGSMRDHRKRGGGELSDRVVKYCHTILHRVFRDAIRANYLTINPCEKIDPPKVMKRPERKIWTADELTAFLRFTEDHRLAALWRLYATTGMRRGEALGLARDHLSLVGESPSLTLARQVIPDFANRSTRGWTFGDPKTDRGSRRIALDPGTAAALQAHLARQAAERLAVGAGWLAEAAELPAATRRELARGGGMVFTTPDGMPLEPASVSGIFERLVKASGLPPVTLHGLRHTWATLALKQGVHPKVVQERLGHSTIGITLDLYSHEVEGMDAAAAECVAGLLDRPTTTTTRVTAL